MAVREHLGGPPTIPSNDLLFNGGPSFLPVYDSNQSIPLLTKTSEGTPIPADNSNHPSSMDSRGYPDYQQQYLGHGSLAGIPERVALQSGLLNSPSALPSEIFISLDGIDDDAIAGGGFASVYIGGFKGSKVNKCISPLHRLMVIRLP
jgi:hypothetical protein